MGKGRKITKEVNLDRILTAYKYNHLAVIKNSFDLLNGSSEIISTLTLLYRGLYNNGFDNNIPEEFKNISHTNIFIILKLIHALDKQNSLFFHCDFCKNSAMSKVNDELEWLYVFKRFEIRMVYFDKSMGDIFDSILVKYRLELSDKYKWLILYSPTVQCPVCQSQMIGYVWDIVTNVSPTSLYLKHVAELMNIYKYLVIEYNRIDNN